MLHRRCRRWSIAIRRPPLALAFPGTDSPSSSTSPSPLNKFWHCKSNSKQIWQWKLIICTYAYHPHTKLDRIRSINASSIHTWSKQPRGRASQQQIARVRTRGRPTAKQSHGGRRMRAPCGQRSQAAVAHTTGSLQHRERRGLVRM
jgi:hypothetical protein